MNQSSLDSCTMKGLSYRRISSIDPNDPIWFRWFREAVLNLEFRSRFKKSRQPLQEVTTTEKSANRQLGKQCTLHLIIFVKLEKYIFRHLTSNRVFIRSFNQTSSTSFIESFIYMSSISFLRRKPACVLMKCNLHQLSFSVITVVFPVFLAEIGEIL